MPTEYDLAIRIVVATLLGALIGMERGLMQKSAGLRTHALVSLGAAAFTVAGFAAFSTPELIALHPDPTRIAAQVVSGIGFVAGGLIILSGNRVKGLTSAANIWSVAAVGVLCGVGFLAIAAVASGCSLLVTIGFRPLERVLNHIRTKWLTEEREHEEDSA